MAVPSPGIHLPPLFSKTQLPRKSAGSETSLSKEGPLLKHTQDGYEG